MKAALLTGIRQLEIRQVPEPQLIRPKDVLLRIHTVGVCGSDIHYYAAGRIGLQVVQYPATVGHECAGIVVAKGRDVTDLQAGQRVAVDPLAPCGECDQCLAGRFHTCRNQSFLGCPGESPGALAEYLVMPSRCCYPIPDSMSWAQAAMVEPFSIGLYAQRMASLPAQAKVAILGSGPMGLCVLLACRAAGPCNTYVTDLLDKRLDVARSSGADWVGNPNRDDGIAEIAKLEPLGLDVVFECAGQQATLDQAVQLLKPGGTLIVIGIPEVDRVSFNIHLLRRKELNIRNVRRQNECMVPAIHLISSGAVNVDRLMTHVFPFPETKNALDLVADYRDGVVKAVVQLLEEV